MTVSEVTEYYQTHSTGETAVHFSKTVGQMHYFIMQNKITKTMNRKKIAKLLLTKPERKGCISSGKELKSECVKGKTSLPKGIILAMFERTDQTQNGKEPCGIPLAMTFQPNKGHIFGGIYE